MRSLVVLAMAAWMAVAGMAAAQVQPAAPLSVVVALGDATPIGGTFARFKDRPNIGPAGDIVFLADVAGGSAPQAIFRAAGGTVSKVVAEGDPTPIGGRFESFRLGRPSPTKSGIVVFGATVVGGRAPRGVFIASGGSIAKIAAEGDPTPAGGTFKELAVHRSSVNDGGAVAFDAQIAGGTAGAGVFRFSGGAIEKVATEGDSVLDGKLGRSYTRPVINARGHVAFRSSLTGSRSREVVLLWSDGALSSLVRAGDIAPGTGGARYHHFMDPDLGERGDVPFRAFLEGGAADDGFFVASPQGVVKLVASGDRLPGGVFKASSGRPLLNAGGLVVFQSRLKGQGKLVGGYGIYTAAQGRFAKVVAEGDATPVGGIFQGVSSASLNDAGAIAFRAIVAGGRTGEGIFVAR
jgi:hypothetical protein